MVWAGKWKETMSKFLDFINSQVLLLDGAMGTQIQGENLDVEKDYWGQENCSEILTLSRPDFIRNVHMKYFAAGSDAVETNTFGGSTITLGEFGLEEKTIEINRRSCELAHEAIAEFSHDGRQRFVIGAIGPGTKLPSLGHIGYDELEASFLTQAEGLIEGRADAILVETSQDPLQVKAAVNGAKLAMEKRGVTLPIMTQVTVETTGTMLVGTDIAAAATIIEALGVDVMGLNCATGPQEMADHVRWLSQNWPRLISVLPNAGLPEMHQGHVHFPLAPEEMARWLERFLKEDGINIVGGCCGTNENHIAAINAMLERQENGKRRPAPGKRNHHWVPAVASLFQQVELRQDNAILSIGERCNANGSKKFREAQDAEDWDTCLDIAKEQIREGSHTLDICTAFVGRNEVKDMSEMLSRLRGSATAPLVIDSTELIVLEAALKLYGGKAIINSINFEDGEEPAHKRMQLAKKYGAAVIALTIDEEGMAKDVDRKLEIAHRLYKFCCVDYGLPPSDLLIDPLTFTICTGNEDDRKLGLWTLEAIERIHKELPDIQIILGLSNISFGLNPAARHVLNSVYLDHAQKRGMTGAIIHVSKIMPLHKIPKHEVEAAEDLIYDRRSPLEGAA
jgi:5-methyltetrahydrofolate--homocysteine methyltransferase